jgi:hypothetical protein
VTKSGLDPVTYSPPDHLHVQSLAVHHGARGFILSRSLEVHGRPVSFVLSAILRQRTAPRSRSDVLLLRKSLNYGFASNRLPCNPLALSLSPKPRSTKGPNYYEVDCLIVGLAAQRVPAEN